MNNRPEEAKNKFGKMMCAAAILTTYKDELGITEAEALSMGPPMSGGRMVTCGAILAAQKVLEKKAPEKVCEIEERFRKKNGADDCSTIKGKNGGPVLRSCPGCIEDAANILEELLKRHD